MSKQNTKRKIMLGGMMYSESNTINCRELPQSGKHVSANPIKSVQFLGYKRTEQPRVRIADLEAIAKDKVIAYRNENLDNAITVSIDEYRRAFVGKLTKPACKQAMRVPQPVLEIVNL